MTVEEAIDKLDYGVKFELRGAYKGKVFHRSWINKDKHAKKFYKNRVCGFYATIRVNGAGAVSNTYVEPVIGIWMHDYDYYIPFEMREENGISPESHQQSEEQ